MMTSKITRGRQRRWMTSQRFGANGPRGPFQATTGPLYRHGKESDTVARVCNRYSNPNIGDAHGPVRRPRRPRGTAHAVRGRPALPGEPEDGHSMGARREAHGHPD